MRQSDSVAAPEAEKSTGEVRWPESCGDMLSGRTILLKGSRSMKLEELVPFL